MGAKRLGCHYCLLPMHKLLKHTTANIKWLWEFGVLIGQLSGEVVENKNQIVCSAMQGTNHSYSTEKLPQSAHYQVMRYMLVQAFCYPHTMYDEPSQAKNSLLHSRCGRCGDAGHYKSNRTKCKDHPDPKGPDDIPEEYLL